MSNKQDRQGVRTAPELERKYDFKGSFQEVRDSIRTVGKAAQQAQKSAERAEEYARSQILQLSNSIKLEVTNDTTGKKAVIKLSVPVGESGEAAEYTGTIDLTGMVTFTNLEEEGATVINGSNIKTGSIMADLIKGGVLSSLDGKMKLDLDSGTLAFYDEEGTLLGNFTDMGGEGFGLFLQNEVGTYVADISADGTAAHIGLGDYNISRTVAEYKDGYLTLNGDTVVAKAPPAEATHAVNKGYVDANFAPAGRGLGTLVGIIPANSMATFKFPSARLYALISLRSQIGTGYSSFLFTGYGPGGAARTQVKRIHGNEYILYGITPQGESPGITIWNYTGNALDVNVLSMIGGQPTMIADSDGGATAQAYDWEDPPMALGVEYPTTERYNGNVVYKKLVQKQFSGTLGNTSGYVDYWIPSGLTEYEILIKAEATIDSKFFLPYVSSTFGIASILDIHDGNIRFRINNDTWSSPIVAVTLYYTKTM